MSSSSDHTDLQLPELSVAARAGDEAMLLSHDVLNKLHGLQLRGFRRALTLLHVEALLDHVEFGVPRQRLRHAAARHHTRLDHPQGAQPEQLRVALLPILERSLLRALAVERAGR
eukprot:scaffold1472_cov310-Prasinococcus_capsulatus_cf.AAC.5